MPRVTDKFIQIHMPKTGGFWLTKALDALLDTAKVPGTRRHSPVSEIPAELREGRTLIATAREACAWYASWYQHAATVDREGVLLAALGNGSPEFRDVLYGMTHPDRITDLPERFAVAWSFRYNEPDYRPSLVASGVGFYSWSLRYFYGDPIDVDVLIDTAQLRDGLEQLIGIELPVNRFPVVNSRHSRPLTAVDDPRSLYDDEMVRWVYEADGAAMGLLGFPGPFETMPEPLLRL